MKIIKDIKEIPYHPNVGSILKQKLNGVKHTYETFAQLKGLDPEKLKRIMQGNEPLTRKVEEAYVSFPGLNQRDLYLSEYQHLFPIIDDTNDGVIIVSQDTT